MEFTVDTDTLALKLADKMFQNIEANAKGQGLSEEEVQATLVLNKKKIANDANQIAIFVKSAYGIVDQPAENTAEQVSE